MRVDRQSDKLTHGGGFFHLIIGIFLPRWVVTYEIRGGELKSYIILIIVNMYSEVLVCGEWNSLKRVENFAKSLQWTIIICEFIEHFSFLFKW